MIAAAQSVTTTGINWESVATVVTCVFVVVGALTAYVGRQITNAINALSDKLESKLETKDNVNSINIRLSQVETTLRNQRRGQAP